MVIEPFQRRNEIFMMGARILAKNCYSENLVIQYCPFSSTCEHMKPSRISACSWLDVREVNNNQATSREGKNLWGQGLLVVGLPVPGIVVCQNASISFAYHCTNAKQILILRAVVIGEFLVGLVGFGRSHPGNLSVRGRSDRPDLPIFGRSGRSDRPRQVGLLFQKTSARVHEKTVLKLSL